MILGTVKHFYDRPSQRIGVIWLAVSCREPWKPCNEAKGKKRIEA